MNLSANSPTQLLSSMMLIRAAELKISIEAKKQTFKTPIHLAIGQEAVAVGVAMALKNSDTVFGNHRSHGHYLATGGELTSLFSEILGNADGCSGGRGGSMISLHEKLDSWALCQLSVARFLFHLEMLWLIKEAGAKESQ